MSRTSNRASILMAGIGLLLLVLLVVLVIVVCACTGKPISGDGQPMSRSDGDMVGEERWKPSNYTGKQRRRERELDLDGATKKKIEEIVKEYISRTKSWPENVYHVRIERKELRYYRVVASHQEDWTPENEVHVGGAGKSVVLYVDVEFRTVIRELRFQ